MRVFLISSRSKPGSLLVYDNPFQCHGPVADGHRALDFRGVQVVEELRIVPPLQVNRHRQVEVQVLVEAVRPRNDGVAIEGIVVGMLRRGIDAGPVLGDLDRKLGPEIRLDDGVGREGNRTFSSPATASSGPAAEVRIRCRDRLQGDDAPLSKGTAAVGAAVDSRRQALDAPPSRSSSLDGQQQVAAVDGAAYSSFGIKAVAVVIRAELDDFAPDIDPCLEEIAPVVPGYGEPVPSEGNQVRVNLVVRPAVYPDTLLPPTERAVGTRSGSPR